MDNPYNTGSEKGSSVIGPTLKFKGELTAEEDLLIHGCVEGSIKHSSNLKIGKEGKIKAEVRAEYIEVHGAVKGDLVGSKSVVVRDSADVSGNIFSPKVSLHDGARFNGNIDMSGEPAAAANKPDQSAPEDKAADSSNQKTQEASNQASANDDAPASDTQSDDSKSASKRKADAA